jgi:hypothetical protein
MPVGGAPSGCALGRPRDGSCFSFTGPLAALAALAVLAPWAASRCSRAVAVVAIRLPVCRGALCVAKLTHLCSAESTRHPALPTQSCRCCSVRFGAEAPPAACQLLFRCGAGLLLATVS